MPDETERDDHEHTHEPKAAATGGGSSTTAPESQDDEKSSDDGVRVRLRGARGWSLFFQGVVAFSTAIYVVFSVLLWRETHEANDLTRRSVEATEKALGLTKESNDLTRQGLEETRKLGEESNALTRKSVQVASDGLEASRKAFQLSERSRLAIKEAKLYVPPSEVADKGIYRINGPAEKTVVATLSLCNNGRIPAAVASVDAALYERRKFTMSAEAAQRVFGQDINYPSAQLTKKYRGLSVPASDCRTIDLEFQRQGGSWFRQQKMVAFVLVTYSDDLGGPRSGRFCLDYLPPPNAAPKPPVEFEACGSDIVREPKSEQD